MVTRRLIADAAVNFARLSLAVREIDEVVVNGVGITSPWDGRETWVARVKSGARTWLIKVKVGEDGTPHASLLKIEQAGLGRG